MKIAATAIFWSFVSSAPVLAQVLIVPQITDGGGWQTTVVFTNMNTSAVSVSMSFYVETGGGNTSPWNLAFLETSSTSSISLPGSSTLYLHTPGTAGTTSVGWGQLTAPSGVVAYAIFTQRVTGRQDQDGTAPAVAGASGVLVPFDNSSGAVTAIAIANPTNSSETIQVGFRAANGTVTQSSISIPAQGHTSFSLPSQFPTVAGQSGLAEFYDSGGSFSLIALRFNVTDSFTAAPVYTETGSPVIVAGSGPGGGGGTLPAFTTLSVPNGTFSPAGQPAFQLQLNISLAQAVYQATVVGENPSANTASSIVGFAAGWTSSSVNGLTITFSGLQIGLSRIDDAGNDISGVTSGSLIVSLSPQPGDPTIGTISGTLTLVSPLVTLSGPISGSYVAQ
ncbi:MAG TPA: hypothetical protein VH640_09300 [Bryobacteraceae bacterium]